MKSQRFSKRHAYTPADKEITIRDDAPAEFRVALLQIAVDHANLMPSTLREIICRTLRKVPDSSNWSEYPNIWGEILKLVQDAPWYRVYDIAEAIDEHLTARSPIAEDFERELNAFFREEGRSCQEVCK